MANKRAIVRWSEALINEAAFFQLTALDPATTGMDKVQAIRKCVKSIRDMCDRIETTTDMVERHLFGENHETVDHK